jgi:predicted metal-dependent phosphoesterase TrpH
MKKKLLTSTLKEAFVKYIGDNKPCYVSGFRYTAKEAIGIIKKAKGIAVIAHPALDGISQFLPKLVEDGIDGLEAFHSDHKKSASDSLLGYAKQHNLLITGGSDCHGRSKGEMLMGTVRLPYSYVEALKNARLAR